MQRIIVFIFFSFVFSVLSSQEDWCRHYKLLFTVISDNGVNMRESGSLDSEVVLAIPFKEEVQVCAGFTGNLKVEVQGKTGYWMKCRYRDKIGYVHSGNLQQVKCNIRDNIWVSFPNDAGFDQMIVGYPINCKANKGIYLQGINKDSFYSKDISYADTSTNYSYLYFGKLREQTDPYFIVHGDANISSKGKCETKEDMFYPGEAFIFKGPQKNQDIQLFCTGHAEKDSTLLSIKDYTMHVMRGSQVFQVTRMDLYGEDGWGYEGGVWLKWIGDLDGDNEVEIILQAQTSYKGFDYIMLKWNGYKYDKIIVGGGSAA